MTRLCAFRIREEPPNFVDDLVAHTHRCLVADVRRVRDGLLFPNTKPHDEHLIALSRKLITQVWLEYEVGKRDSDSVNRASARIREELKWFAKNTEENWSPQKLAETAKLVEAAFDEAASGGVVGMLT